MKKLAQLGVMRIATLSALLIQNVLIVRQVGLDEIGRYYIIATVAYLGNAAFFVGSSLVLQRKLATVSTTRLLDPRGLAGYVSVTGAAGSSFLLIVSILYFWSTGGPVVTLPLICCLLSLATYLSAVTRDIVLLCDQPVKSASLQTTEALVKLVLIFAVTASPGATAEHIVAASSAASLLAAAVGATLLMRITRRHRQSYRETPVRFGKQLTAVGTSGLLNWAQLQGYRPLVAAMHFPSEIVGTVALLTTLGGTAANAVCSVMAQLNVPRQYASGGKSSFRYLQQLLLAIAATCIAVLPLGYLFIELTGKTSLRPFLYLVGIGVLLESGNAIVGIALNHCSVQERPLWHLPLGGAMGCVATAVILLAVPMASNPYARIAAALLCGQLVSVAVVWLVTSRMSGRAYAEQ
jgi:hypothetical protein